MTPPLPPVYSPPNVPCNRHARLGGSSRASEEALRQTRDAARPLDRLSWSLWENAVYLLPDKRRAEVFQALRDRVGLTPEALLKADKDVLLELAKRAGMQPEVRVLRWRQIAMIAQDQGNLEEILKLPYKQAKSILKMFPSIGDPAAEKILLYCGMAAELPLESNGLRVLTRYGFGEASKNYGATYKSVQQQGTIQALCPPERPWR